MSKRVLILTGVLSVAVGLLACSKPEPEVPAEPTLSAEQMQQEQEAAKRSQETTGLEKRLAGIGAPVSELTAAIGSGRLPTDLEASIGRLGARLEDQEQLLTEVREAQGDSWTAARDRLQTMLDDLERESKSVQAALGDWRQRERAATAARSQTKLPIDAATGLIQGLDGGDYEQYLVSVVQRVQESLRAGGTYAGPADGTFDAATQEAIGHFQESEQLAVSGVPSPMTRSRLFADRSPE